MFTEDQLLKLLKVQSNLSPKDFEDLFGERGRRLFNIFSRESWNLVSFLFNKVSGEDREKLLNHVNSLIQ
jgi:Fe-S cluster biosynthesis and repair protein YggX